MDLGPSPPASATLDPSPPSQGPEPAADSPEPENRKRSLGAFGISLILHGVLLLVLSFIVIRHLLLAPPPVAVEIAPPPVLPEEIVEPDPPPSADPVTVDDLPPTLVASSTPSLEPIAAVRVSSAASSLQFSGPASDDGGLPDVAPAAEVSFLAPGEAGEAEIIGIGDAPPAPKAGPPKAPPKPPSGGGVSAVKPGFAARTGSKQASLGKFGGTKESEEAVDRALNWLARNQQPDGRWSAKKHGGMAKPHPSIPAQEVNFDTGVTALALLAFLGAGHSETEGKYAAHVRRGIYWLESIQDKNSGRWPGSHYSHALASLAIAEAYGMSGAHQACAQKALEYLVASQNPGGGWNYDPNLHDGRNRNDSSLSGWCVMAAKSLHLAGLQVPPSLFERARAHFEKAGAGGSSGAGNVNYAIHSSGKVEATQGPKTGPEAVRSIAMISLAYMGVPTDAPWMLKAADMNAADGVRLDNLYYVYYATLAMFQVGGERWDNWNRAMRDNLIARQIRGTLDDGAWESTNDRWGPQGGKAYTTALGAMTLEVYYRYLPIYKK